MSARSGTGSNSTSGQAGLAGFGRQVGARREAIDEIDDEVVGLAADDVVAVLERLVRQKGDVRAAHHDGNSRTPGRLRKLVGAGGRRRDRRDAHQVRREERLKIDRRHLLDEHLHVVSGRLQPRAQKHQAEARQLPPAEHVPVRRLRLNQHHLLHSACLRPSPRAAPCPPIPTIRSKRHQGLSEKPGRPLSPQAVGQHRSAGRILAAYSSTVKVFAAWPWLLASSTARMPMRCGPGSRPLTVKRNASAGSSNRPSVGASVCHSVAESTV